MLINFYDHNFTIDMLQKKYAWEKWNIVMAIKAENSLHSVMSVLYVNVWHVGIIFIWFPFALHKKNICNLILLDQRLPKGWERMLRWIPKIGLFIGFVGHVVPSCSASMKSSAPPRQSSKKLAFIVLFDAFYLCHQMTCEKAEFYFSFFLLLCVISFNFLFRP